MLEGEQHVAVALIVEPLHVAEVIANGRQVCLFEEITELVLLGAGLP